MFIQVILIQQDIPVQSVFGYYDYFAYMLECVPSFINLPV